MTHVLRCSYNGSVAAAMRAAAHDVMLDDVVLMGYIYPSPGEKHFRLTKSQEDFTHDAATWLNNHAQQVWRQDESEQGEVALKRSREHFTAILRRHPQIGDKAFEFAEAIEEVLDAKAKALKASPFSTATLRRHDAGWAR